MANFVVGVEVVTAGPSVEISSGPALQPGKHRFRLVVEDDAGNLSVPAFIDVELSASSEGDT